MGASTQTKIAPNVRYGIIRDKHCWEKDVEIEYTARNQNLQLEGNTQNLPYRSILANRHMKVSSQCLICSQGGEDIHHGLFTCKHAAKVWRAMGLDEFKKDALVFDRSGSTSLEYLIRLARKKSLVLGQPKLQTMFKVAAWYIW
jgi:hypothetical protein